MGSTRIALDGLALTSQTHGQTRETYRSQDDESFHKIRFDINDTTRPQRDFRMVNEWLDIAEVTSFLELLPHCRHSGFNGRPRLAELFNPRSFADGLARPR